jgi:2-keto-4-pentenoate hydratase/2-oxohepta-3-ene-1,7-dioic acid hydratase in catechol pathway
VDYEGELAVVVGLSSDGRPTKDVAAGDAVKHVFGYTAANDVTARDQQRADGLFTRAKGYDSFCPLGPWIETELDPADLGLVTTVNGDVRQSGRTSDMVHRIPRLIEFISAVMTLLPGDVILTGTPEGVGPIVAGDTVSVRIDGIGELSNPVAMK